MLEITLIHMQKKGVAKSKKNIDVAICCKNKSTELLKTFQSIFITLSKNIWIMQNLWNYTQKILQFQNVILLKTGVNAKKLPLWCMYVYVHTIFCGCTILWTYIIPQYVFLQKGMCREMKVPRLAIKWCLLVIKHLITRQGILLMHNVPG